MITLGIKTNNQPLLMDWNLTENRHLLITGNTGSGKTYALRSYAVQANNQGIPVLILDYSGSFSTAHFKNAKFPVNYRNIYEHGFPCNPFRREFVSINSQQRQEKKIDVAIRVATSLAAAFTLGNQQTGFLYRLIKNGLIESESFSFESLSKQLATDDSPFAQSILGKLAFFFDNKIFTQDSSFSWKNIVHTGSPITIADMNGFSKTIKVLTTDLILHSLWCYAQRNFNEKTSFILILDEYQNLNWKEDSPSSLILKEGRKFGFCGWFGTQTLKALSPIIKSHLNMASTKLYFKTPYREAGEVAKTFDTSDTLSLQKQLSILPRGSCITNSTFWDPFGEIRAGIPTLIHLSESV